MQINIFRWRTLAASIAFMVLTCGAPARIYGASANLWIALDSGRDSALESYASGQLKKSGMPTPTHLSTFSSARGLAFDKSHNLWAVIDEINEVVRFTPAQLKNLRNDPNPTPDVVITSASTFRNPVGCNFDGQGNLWVVDYSNASLDELSKAQLAAGSGDVTPAIVITSPDLDSPDFVTFDKAGNAWLNDEDISIIAKFSARQLTSSGSKSPALTLSDDGSGSSLSIPGEITFDESGNLWVPNFGSDTVAEYAKTQLTKSGKPVPKVKFTSAIFHSEEPWGAAFNSKGDLFVMNWGNGVIAEFKPTQLRASGAPVPKVTVTGTENLNVQISFGPGS